MKIGPEAKVFFAQGGGIGGGVFSPPVTALEHALLEQEGFGSQKLSIKDNFHGFVAGLFQVGINRSSYVQNTICM